MYKIQTLNKISPTGLNRLAPESYQHASDLENPDAILVRSQKLHDIALPDTLKAIGRAGAGVNNIPIDQCSEKGIVVFNTPGANANGVKELILLGLLLSSRRVCQGINWAQDLKGKGSEVPKLIEKGKSNFAGPEIKGKKLGVIGLGAIGVMVANDAQALGMDVFGRDPFISIDSAWGLSRSVKKAVSLDALIADSDYISLNVPLNDKTKGFINKEKFAIMKKGVKILNFARGGLVNNKDLLEAIESGIVSTYVTDFPDEEMLGNEHILTVPHLGASTPESEDNCAVMAVNQVKDFLENGNITNSVNFPDCHLAPTKSTRILIANKNLPHVIGHVTNVLSNSGINITDMINKSRDQYAYSIIDVENNIDVNDEVISSLNAIDNVVMVRVL